MSAIQVRQLCVLSENGYEGEHTPAPAFELRILIDNQYIPDIRLKNTGFTSIVVPSNSVLELSGQPDNLYWVNGLSCNHTDRLINSTDKPIEVHIFRLDTSKQTSSIFPLTS